MVGYVCLNQIIFDVLELHQVIHVGEDLYAARETPVAGFGNGGQLGVEDAVCARNGHAGGFEGFGCFELVEEHGCGVGVAHGAEGVWQAGFNFSRYFHSGIAVGYEDVGFLLLSHPHHVVFHARVVPGQTLNHFPGRGQRHFGNQLIAYHLHLGAKPFAALFQQFGHRHAPAAAKHQYGDALFHRLYMSVL